MFQLDRKREKSAAMMKKKQTTTIVHTEEMRSNCSVANTVRVPNPTMPTTPRERFPMKTVILID